jgi:hypothetical protein
LEFKININDIQSKIYAIDIAENKNLSYSYLNKSVDYNLSKIEFSTDIKDKNITLKELNIKANNIKSLIHEIRDIIITDAINLIDELGQKHRDEKNCGNKYDIVISDILKENELFYVRDIIFEKINKILNYLSYKSIYSAKNNYIITDNDTYVSLLTHIKSFDFYINVDDVFISKRIKDNCMLFGSRYNDSRYGIRCAILTDKDKNILINKYNDYYSINYLVFYIGEDAKDDFYKVHTNDLSYFRNKKLKIINSI